MFVSYYLNHVPISMTVELDEQKFGIKNRSWRSRTIDYLKCLFREGGELRCDHCD